MIRDLFSFVAICLFMASMMAAGPCFVALFHPHLTAIVAASERN